MFTFPVNYNSFLNSEYGLHAKKACEDLIASILPKRVNAMEVHAMMSTHEKQVNDIYNMVMLVMILVLLASFMYLQDKYKNTNVVIKFCTFAAYLYVFHCKNFDLRAQKHITTAITKKAYAHTPEACSQYMEKKIQDGMELDHGLCHKPKDMNVLLNQRYSTIHYIVYRLSCETLVLICISHLIWHYDGTRKQQGA